MLISAVGAGLLVGLALKGQLQRLAAISPKFASLFAAAIALHAVSSVALGDSFQRTAYFASLCLLVLFLAVNLRLTAAPIALLGASLNTLAVALYAGTMPVYSGAAERAGIQRPDVLHSVTSDFLVIGDVLPLPPFGTYSVGDVLLAVALFMFVVASMRVTE